MSELGHFLYNGRELTLHRLPSQRRTPPVHFSLKTSPAVVGYIFHNRILQLRSWSLAAQKSKLFLVHNTLTRCSCHWHFWVSVRMHSLWLICDTDVPSIQKIVSEVEHNQWVTTIHCTMIVLKCETCVHFMPIFSSPSRNTFSYISKLVTESGLLCTVLILKEASYLN